MSRDRYFIIVIINLHVNVLGFRKYRKRMAYILFVHDHRRSVQKSIVTSRGVQSVAEGRHDGRQFWWSVPGRRHSV